MISDLVYKKNKLNKRLEKLSIELCEVEKQIKESCTHSDMIKKSSWSCGGYDYQGEDRTWDECPVCGHTSNLKIRYTGFG
jgi:rubrerythrin